MNTMYSLQIPIDDSVLLRVTHSNLKSFSFEIGSVNDKLWRKCGTSVNFMRFELFDDCGVKVCDLSDDSRPLGFFSPKSKRRVPFAYSGFRPFFGSGQWVAGGYVVGGEVGDLVKTWYDILHHEVQKPVQSTHHEFIEEMDQRNRY